MWQLTHSRTDEGSRERLETLLREGWEPFSVSDVGQTIWLKRNVLDDVGNSQGEEQPKLYQER